MIVSARAVTEAGLLGKWVKASPEEIKAIEDSIAGENLVRAPRGIPNLRHHVRDGYICVTEQECEAHPNDLPA
ncbi:MAG TPA: hypothetical protein VGR34_06110 [Candidatus Dormibacteraeota bacterium]|nr:hypothetical protein [Candidatus Dormibacteraeota bacterium]